MLSYYRLQYLVSDSKSHFFVIWGSDWMAEALCRLLKLLDIEPAYCMDLETDSPRQLPCGVEVRNVYSMLYEENLRSVIVLVFGKQASVMKPLTGMGLDPNKNIKDICEYRAPLFQDVQYMLDAQLGYIRPVSCQGVYGFSCFGPQDAELTIAALGGSTTDDAAWDCKMWPQILQERLQRDGYSVKVICGGNSGYNIYQEMLLLIRDVLAMKPDIVIDYSGANQIGGAVIPDYPNVNHYQKMLFESLALRQRIPFYIGELTQQVNYGHKNTGSLYQNYMEVLRIMEAACRSHGITFVNYIQPLSFASYDRWDTDMRERMLNQSGVPVRRSGIYKEACAFYREMELSEKESYQTDLSWIFNGIEGSVYFDYVHVNAYGNTLAAEAILHDLADRKLVAAE